MHSVYVAYWNNGRFWTPVNIITVIHATEGSDVILGPYSKSLVRARRATASRRLRPLLRKFTCVKDIFRSSNLAPDFVPARIGPHPLYHGGDRTHY